MVGNKSTTICCGYPGLGAKMLWTSKEGSSHNMQIPHFASREEYGKRFTDVKYWRPYVEAICTRHNFGPCNSVQAGFPGSNPVFIVNGEEGRDGGYVVKLYTHLFSGAESYLKELELYGLFARFPQLPFPTLVENGSLFPEGEGWYWPSIWDFFMVTRRFCGRF